MATSHDNQTAQVEPGDKVVLDGNLLAVMEDLGSHGFQVEGIIGGRHNTAVVTNEYASDQKAGKRAEW